MADEDEDLLALAEKADRAAFEAQTETAKRCWQNLAREYRLLHAEKIKVKQVPKKAS